MDGVNFKPGDVAMVTVGLGDVRPMILIGHKPVRCWHGVERNGDLCCLDDSQAESVRPLVVIDPEDELAIDRLHDAIYHVDGGFSTSRGSLLAALRSLIPPPKPEEPMGLGAVVEVDGQHGDRKRLVRTHHSNAPWFGDAQSRSWNAIAGPITVLSEGVVS